MKNQYKQSMSNLKFRSITKTKSVLNLIRLSGKCSFIAIMLNISTLSIGAQEKINISTLLEEMTDRKQITYFPEKNYKCAQFSSYERASVSADSVSWFANADFSNFLRTELNGGRKEYVMFDAIGPGAVVRIWMTGGGVNRGKGILRVYIDDATLPVIVQPAFEWVSENPIGHPLSVSVAESLDYEVRGHNLYLPIPYDKSCKITYQSDAIHEKEEDKQELLYYNINYRTYTNNVDIVSYSPSELHKSAMKIALTNNALLEKNTIGELTSEKLLLAASEVKKISFNQKNTAITELSIKLNDPQNIAQQLRSTTLKLIFDGNQTVYMPLGDFFGTVVDTYSTESWYIKIDKERNELISYFVMPFQNTCEIELANNYNCPIDIGVSIKRSTYDWNNRSMYFGASWWQKQKLDTGQSKLRNGEGGCFDMNYITLTGKGVYIADVLTIYNPILSGHWKVWWGEGDEKIYVDGEEFPSHFGTGTEDYYGYAWCRGNKFSHPYIAQPIGEGNLSTGLSINLRQRALDAIPFNKSLKVDMEIWHWSKTKVDIAPTTYYYAFADTKTNINTLSISDIQSKVSTNRYDVLTSMPENGILECEDLIVNNFKNIYGEYVESLSGGLALKWHPHNDNKTLYAEFKMAQKCKNNITIVGEHRDIESYKIVINNKLYTSIKTDKGVVLRNVQLKEGTNYFSVEVDGVGKDATLLIDYFKFD